MPDLALDTGKTHEAAGFHITYWQRGRGMAARSAWSGYQEAGARDDRETLKLFSSEILIR
jgi:hypothetical protein